MLLTRRARDGRRWWRRDANESEHTFARVSMRSKLEYSSKLLKTVTLTSKDMLSPEYYPDYVDLIVLILYILS